MKFKKGDRVRVSNNGAMYTTYDEWFGYSGADNLCSRYKKRTILPAGTLGIVEHTGKHNLTGGPNLCAISVGDDIYLIGECGLEMVEPNINVYIYGDPERGGEVIKMLEDCGGVNKHGLFGDTDDLCPKMYYISPLGNAINYCKNPETNAALKEKRTELKLPEKPKFKDGDIVTYMGVLGKIGCDDCSRYGVKDKWEKKDWFNIKGLMLASSEEAKLYHKVVDLNIKNIDEPKQYDRVLVRDSENEEWKINILIELNKQYDLAYRCLDDSWAYAIPYEGNEHLLNKIK